MTTSVNLKICPSCGKSKSLNSFSKDKHTKLGLRVYCKSCMAISKQKYFRTKKGLITKIYHGQRRSSEKRNHPYPSYTKQNFIKWVLNQPIFHQIYDKWIESNYSNKLIPSIDRLDDAKPYSFENIQITNWKQNNQKSLKIYGGLDKIQVKQLDKNGFIVNKYSSLLEAEQYTGISRGNISKCLNGSRKTAGGYFWKCCH